MNYKKIVFFIYFFLISLPTYAAETRVPCLKKDGTIGFNVFEKFDCDLMKKVVEDPAIKMAHQDKLNAKLAERLSFKIERKLEEISAIDKYFNKLELDFTKSKDVKNNCNLDVIATPSCMGKPGFNKKSYDVLISKINSSGNTLTEKMFNLFSQRRGIDHKANKNCPLQAPSGYYTLDALFDDIVVRQLKENLEKDRGSKSLKNYLDFSYKKYPQLTLINKADKGDGSFKKKFEDYVLKNPGNTSNKAYILGFFAEKANQETLSKGLEKSCTDLRENIDKFVCNTPKDLLASESTAHYLFEADPDIEDSVTVANAFMCGIEDEQAIKQKDKAGDFLDVFTSNVVPQLAKNNEKKASIQVNNFCDIYTCNSEEVKSAMSCKAGGPVSIQDLKEIFKCTDGSEESNTCGLLIKQTISYLQSMDTVEIDKQNIEHAKHLGISIPTDTAKKSTKDSKYSTFLQNFLGVEGTLKAEGKPLTSENVAEKVREFTEKKIDPIPQQNRDIILASNEGNKVFNMIKQQKQDEVLHQQVQHNQMLVQNPVVVGRENEEQRQAVIAESINRFTKTDSAFAKREDNHSGSERERLSEISRMRSELESVVKSMKGTEEEKLETITDSNVNYARAKSFSPADPVKNMGREDRERLESYRTSLNNWETRLREREADLVDREFRGGARATASDTGDSREDGRFKNSQQQNDQPNPMAQNTAMANQNAPSLKLTKTQQGQGGANGEREGASEKLPGATIEGESAVVAAENLATLERSGLKKLGLGSKDSFVIKVRLLDKIYDVPVKNFVHNGKAMYVPLLNKENRDLAKIILDSPLFYDYRQYQAERLRSQSL